MTEIIEIASSKNKCKHRPKLFCHSAMQCFKNTINCILDIRLESVQHGNKGGEEGVV